MKSFANHLAKLRTQNQFLARDVAASLGIDAAMVSRFENGTRLPTRVQVTKLAGIFKTNPKDLLVLWLAEKVLEELGNDPFALEALSLAEEKVQYIKSNSANIAKPFAKALKQIDTLKAQLDVYRKNDNVKLAEALAIEYTYESNKIEGNTFNLQETALVIHEGITISGKSMREHLEAINHYDAIILMQEMVQQKLGLNESLVLKLHNLVLRGIDKDNAGIYRRVQVRISGSEHIPPEPFLVPIKMEELFVWYEMNRHSLHPVVLAAEMHERLVSIHPFIDGNGRTSRLIMNLILLQNGLTIANLKGDVTFRLEYYKCLEAARTNPAKTEFINLIIRYTTQGLEKYLQLLKV